MGKMIEIKISDTVTSHVAKKHIVAMKLAPDGMGIYLSGDSVVKGETSSEKALQAVSTVVQGIVLRLINEEVYFFALDHIVSVEYNSKEHNTGGIMVYLSSGAFFLFKEDEIISGLFDLHSFVRPM
jgi:hypothetical protein